MSQKNHSKSHDVFVPLVSLVISDSLQREIDPVEIKIETKDQIGESGVELCRLNSGTSLKELKDFKLDNDLMFKEGSKKFVVKEMMGSRANYRFNSGLLFKFTQKNPDQIAIFPNTFENVVRNPVTFLRLFTPGDIFTPYALIDSIDVVHLHEFSGGRGHGGDMGYIYKNQVSDFIGFYTHYVSLANSLYKNAKENTNKLTGSWYKRINNAIYFYNQTYFSHESNTYNPEARNGNQLRLIFLCTALDALLGSGKASGKQLSELTHQAIGKVSPKAHEHVLNMYDLRSRYVHANPYTLQSHIKNSDIAKLKAIIQKIILLSLELSADDVYVNALIKQNTKHWFELLNHRENNSSVRKGIQSIFRYKDGFEIVSEDLYSNLMNLWERESRL